MARTAAAGFWSRIRAWARPRRRCLGGADMAAGRGWCCSPRWLPALAAPIRSRARRRSRPPAAMPGWSSSSPRMSNPKFTTAGSILVIRFKRPVDIPVDQLPERGARLCRLGAARSRRLGDPAVAGAQGDRQHHDRGRTGIRRSVARQLERPAAEPSARGGPRTGRARAGRRARLAAAARVAGGKETRRRFACAPRCSRPSSASCSKCPTASASRRC